MAVCGHRIPSANAGPVAYGHHLIGLDQLAAQQSEDPSDHLRRMNAAHARPLGRIGPRWQDQQVVRGPEAEGGDIIGANARLAFLGQEVVKLNPRLESGPLGLPIIVRPLVEVTMLRPGHHEVGPFGMLAIVFEHGRSWRQLRPELRAHVVRTSLWQI